MILKVVKELKILGGYSIYENDRGFMILKPGHVLVPNDNCGFNIASTPTESSQWGFMDMTINVSVVLRNPECFSSLTIDELKKMTPHFSKKFLSFLGLRKEDKINPLVLGHIEKELKFRENKKHSLQIAESHNRTIQWSDLLINKHITIK